MNKNHMTGSFHFGAAKESTGIRKSKGELNRRLVRSYIAPIFLPMALSVLLSGCWLEPADAGDDHGMVSCYADKDMCS